MAITYKETKGKIVICKDGVYMAFTKEQLKEMKAVLDDIERATRKFYKEDTRLD